MKVLTVAINGATYTTERVTTGLSREAMRINTGSLAYVAHATAPLAEGETAESRASGLLEEALELSDRKLALIVRVFGDKFSLTDAENSLTNEEVDRLVNDIVRGVNGIASKN